MSKVDINSDQWCDLVFENRNTEFGAFVLRKDSSRRHMRAMLIASIFFLLAITAPILIKKVIEATRPAQTITKEFTDLGPSKPTVKDPEPIIPPEKLPDPVRNTVIFVAPVIAPDDQVAPDEEIKAAVDVLEDQRAIGTEDINTGTDDVSVPVTNNPIVGTEEPPVIEVATVDPQFRGGEVALYEYLSKNLVYPQSAIDLNIQGKVVLRFVVGRDGRISDIEVVRSLDPACDEEAKRVVKAMPPWTPGKQGDVVARVRMSLPINFALQNSQ